MTFMPDLRPPTKWELFRGVVWNLCRLRFRRAYYLLNLFFGRIPKFRRFKFPIIKQVYPSISSEDIVSVQPMVKPDRDGHI